MEARIVIDLGTATPPYEQVKTQIASLIAVGELHSGTRLPTIRSLAGDLGVAAGTVARAYKELEAVGLVTSNRRQGTVVAGSRHAQPLEDQAPPPAPEVLAAVDQLLEAGEQAGLDEKTLISLIQGRLRQRRAK
ncbi:GntR family transcriptional regulator [Arthrobacter sp.]|uniref:GntR family transcriptional regulator n=1 Tax=Arthrobacter sp. TaxID=1667 RepID=UPI0026E085DA|nr:GntR family transcriptional regulator [Arthrobacter sp.]MDO5752258.1 GntR family transcriptional regulator [Arthrobacter sp.]